MSYAIEEYLLMNDIEINQLKTDEEGYLQVVDKYKFWGKEEYV